VLATLDVLAVRLQRGIVTGHWSASSCSAGGRRRVWLPSRIVPRATNR
jgi:hypothetical protein